MKTLIIVTHPHIEELLPSLWWRACSLCLPYPICPITAIIIINEKIIFNLIIQFSSKII